MRTIKINQIIGENEFGTDDAVEIIFDGKKSSARWSVDAAREIQRLHGLDLSEEIVIALVQELDHEFQLTENEKDNCKNEILAHFI